MNTIKTLIAVCLLGFVWPQPLVAWNPFSRVENETVMAEGAIIEATNKFGTIKIEAGKGTRRTYSWDQGREDVRLRKRPSRWYGSLGLYHPGGGKHVHLVVEEGIQHFCSEREAREWLLKSQDRMDWVCSSDGLFVGWYSTKKPDEESWAVLVSVWRICINGHTLLSLGSDGKSSLNVSGEIEPCKSTFVPSEPRVINGRLYSGKALDLMEEREISPEDVETTISKDRGARSDEERILYKRRTRTGWIIVVLDQDGRVVNVQG